VTRTKPSLLIVLALLGGGVGWLLESMLVSLGSATLVPPFTLGAVLGLIGVLIVLLAIPVFRVVRKAPGAQVDPFYATRVVLLAKASSLAGALASGIAIALLVFVLTRSVLPAGGSVIMIVVTVVGAIVLLVGGLVAEKMCTLPPEDEQQQKRPPQLDGAK
jgi:hypothetical protein